MSDIEAPMQYAEPAEDRTAREGSIGLLVLLALGLAIAAVALAMMSRDTAEPFVLAILAGLSVVGVFSLFAGAVGILHFGERAGRFDIARAYVDNMPVGALVTAASGEVLYANEAYRRLVGAGEEDSVVSVERAFSGHARVAEQIFRLARAARQGRAWTEQVMVSPEESGGLAAATGTRWFRISVRQIPAGPGLQSRSTLTVWQVADVSTERREEENAFEKLQQVIGFLDKAPAGFISASSDGRIEYLNATLARWLDLDLSEVATGGLNISDLMSGDAAALLTRTGGDTSSAAARHLDIDLVRADGTSLPVRILHRGMPLGEAAGELSHMLVLNREKGATAATDAQTAEIRFSRFFHSAPIAIATVDAQGRIGSTNAAFARMFSGLGDHVVPGQTGIAGLVSADSRDALNAAVRTACSGQVAVEPVAASFGDRDERNARFYVSPIQQADSEQDAAVVYAIDTTEQRALEEQFVQSQKMQAIGQLAGGIAHDFNNVLTAIIGFSELLLANHRPTDPAFQDIMNIKQNANRAAGLVRQLLAFSRQQTLRPQVLSVNDVLGDLSILLGRLLGENVEFEVEKGRDLWLVRADQHQFEQVIINLAVNARDAMPDGGKLTIRTANITERESRQLGHKGMGTGEYVLCEVADTGTGMTPEVMEKIFEPFFSTKEVGKGTGLGLATVYGIVKQTGGYVYPESAQGRGTTFRIYLPRYAETAERSRAADEAQRTEKHEKPRDLTGTGTVLLVEDEDAVRSFAVRALTARGYTVLEAATGAEALEVMDEHAGEVDLVVSDVVMPEMDGPTLLKKLRARNSNVKMIFISGYAEDAFKKNLEGEEDFAFLPKPFSLKQLAEAVKAALES